MPIFVGIVWVALDARSVSRDLARPRDLQQSAYRPSGACQRCHPSQFESWTRTFHSTMTRRASEASVLGDFDDARMTYGGVEARMERDEAGAFTMRFIGPGGREWSRATVVRTIGTRRYQQYLAADGDVLFRLPVAWHVGEQRWFHMNGAFLTPDPPLEGASVSPSDYYRHVTRWNDNCIFCHNVAPNPGHRSEPGGVERWDTEVAELGIACGACHGPADEHARINRDPVRRYALHLWEEPDPTIVNPRRLSSARSAQVCGRCHGQRIAPNVERFMREGDPFIPGEELRDYTRPLARNTRLGGDATAFADRFWADGTARLTAYEYQGLLQSRCDDLACTSCHGMHEGDPRGQIRPTARGDAACAAQCHQASLAGRNHTGHASAIACVDCHMPRIVYGVIGVHRSHRIESPSPRTDRPNACALCHADRGDAWIAAGHERLYGGATARSPSEPADAWPRVHRDALGGDPIERAVALHALGDVRGLRRRPRRVALLFDTLVEDPYPALRHIAHDSLTRLLDGLPAGFVPEASREARRRWVEAARAGVPLDPPSPAEVAELRARAANEAISIGE